MYPWLHLGPFAISTYSLLFLCAFIVGGIVTYYEAKRLNRATEAILRVALGALAGGLIGAKLSMLLFLGPATFIKDLPYLWYSGQAWTGAFFGGYIAVLLVKRFSHIKYSTGDVFALALPLAQAIGRLGNLLGEHMTHAFTLITKQLEGMRESVTRLTHFVASYNICPCFHMIR
ncbi:MAG: prolipoprotein diacylglyceryl transferase [Chloroflexi bacterium]|nr:MAG: prolipoprotein diacylglyceryl transferase [Chloroflexota bacterium]